MLFVELIVSVWEHVRRISNNIILSSEMWQHTTRLWHMLERTENRRVFSFSSKAFSSRGVQKLGPRQFVLRRLFQIKYI